MEYLKPAYKQMNDTVHGYIPLTRLATEIIDTEQFKRLERLHQLGTCFYVFRGATHTRFEHSVGTYHLAERICRCISVRTPRDKLDSWLIKIPELQNYYTRSHKKKNLFDDYVIELIKIAALCHDLGHGSFSHVFDDVFLSHLPDTHTMRHHEARSCAILEKIISDNIELANIIAPTDREFIKSLINPPDDRSGFVYQIVSNNLNGIDVDKIDYLSRDSQVLRPQGSCDFQRLTDDVFVIDDVICYPKQAHLNVVDLFSLRYHLHKQMYNHKTVIAIEYMIVDAMRLVDPLLRLTDSIAEIDEFCRIDDGFVMNSIKFMALYVPEPPEEILDAYKLLQRVNTRDLYVFIGSHVSTTKYDLDLNRLLEDTDVIPDDIIVHYGKIGYVSGNKTNPLDHVFYYDRKDVASNMVPKKFGIDERHQVTLLPTNYQEYIMLVFYKHNDPDIIAELTARFSVAVEK